MSKDKGDRWERHYRNALNATDPEEDRDDYERIDITDFAYVEPYTVVRMPSSGSATTDDLPDLHVWVRTDEGVDEYAVEAKATRSNTRLSNEEVAALRRFAERTGAEPMVFVHVDYVGDFVFPVDDLHSTAKGYSIRKRRDIVGVEDVTPLDEWVRKQVDV